MATNRSFRLNEAVVANRASAPVSTEPLRVHLMTGMAAGHNVADIARVKRPAIETDIGLGVRLPQAPKGYTRADAKLPISPAPQPADTLVFADPKEAGKTYWLPRYRLRSDRGRYEIVHAADADGLFTIRFGLETFPAPELQAINAQVLPHGPGMEIRYRAANSSIQKRLPTAEVTHDARGQVLTLKVTLEERDSLLRAFRSDEAQVHLIVMRTIQVAVPLSIVRPIELRRVVLPARVASPAAAPHMLMARPMDRMPSDGPVREGDPRGPIRPGPVVLPPVRPRPVGVPPVRPGPIVVPDPLPPTPPVVTEPRFQDYHATLEWAIPLRFDQAEHPYLFPAGASMTAVPEFERILLHYPAEGAAGRMHAYFRDVTRPDHFYFLPDSFKLARTGEPPFIPALVFRVDEREAGTTEVELSCEVRPETDGKRLLAAKAELQAHVRVQAGSAESQPTLKPLAARARLRLHLPRGGAVELIDSVADVDLANGFLVTERFAINDFQDVFAAMATSSVSSVLRGNVVVSTGLAADDLVPFDIRFTDMEGETFVYTEVTDSAASTVGVTLRNATESKMRIDALPSWVRRGGAIVEARIEGIDFSAPIELAPDATLSFTVRPLQPLPGEGALDAVFDTSSVRTIPDPEVFLRLTLDSSVAQETERPITVMTAADVLASAEAPENAIRLILVEFRGNRRVTLDSTNLQTDVNVPVPLVDILLRKDTEGVYKYRQTIIYKSGRQSVDSSWRESDTGLLFVPME